MISLWIIDISGATPDLPWFERQYERIIKNEFSVSEMKHLQDGTQKFYVIPL